MDRIENASPISIFNLKKYADEIHKNNTVQKLSTDNSYLIR